MAPHSSTLAWKIPWMGEPGRLQSMGSLQVRHDWATSLWLFTFMHWRRTWQPTPVFQWVGSKIQVAKGLELQLQHQSFQWIFKVDFIWDWLVWCSPRDSQESSPEPQFKNINSLVLSLLYGQALISAHDDWKKYNFNYEP